MSGKEFYPNRVPIYNRNIYMYAYKKQKKTFRFGGSTSNT